MNASYISRLFAPSPRENRVPKAEDRDVHDLLEVCVLRLAARALGIAEAHALEALLPDDEDRALDALARLAAANSLTLGDDTRFAGMFRAHGRLVPVWDLPRDRPADQWERPVAELAQRYAAALADPAPLDAGARRSRQGLLGRQLTLR